MQSSLAPQWCTFQVTFSSSPIGLTLPSVNPATSWPRVICPVNHAAKTAGVLAGDTICAVNGVDVRCMEWQALLQHLRYMPVVIHFVRVQGIHLPMEPSPAVQPMQLSQPGHTQLLHPMQSMQHTQVATQMATQMPQPVQMMQHTQMGHLVSMAQSAPVAQPLPLAPLTQIAAAVPLNEGEPSAKRHCHLQPQVFAAPSVQSMHNAHPAGVCAATTVVGIAPSSQAYGLVNYSNHCDDEVKLEQVENGSAQAISLEEEAGRQELVQMGFDVRHRSC